jgi:lipid-A-disaccharide synthase
MPGIFIVTGEASGDAVGAGLADLLRAERPDIPIAGIGGRRMRDAGVRLFADSGKWAAIGIMQAAPMIWKLTRLLNSLKAHLLTDRPDALVLVDFGAFNVRLGTWAKENGIRTVYLMPPGSWRRTANPARLQKLAAAADLFLTPFAWNAASLEALGAQAVHIGHPALDFAAPEPTASEKAGPARRIALLPGSRRHEVETLAPVMARVARAWPFPEDRFTLVKAPSFTNSEILELLRRGVPNGLDALPNLDIVEGNAAAVFHASDLAVVCSGTAALEGAIAGVPMVVVYDGPLLMQAEWMLRRRWLKIGHMAMPNIIADSLIVPELRADEVTEQNIVRTLRQYVDDPGRAADTRRRLLEVRAALEPRGALQTAAREILDMVDAAASAPE